MSPSSSSTCPSCGRPIPEGAPDGLCPRCLMLGAAETAPTVRGAAVLPTRDEITSAFPGLEIGEMLGYGGMGAVFRARQPKLERDVALKVLPRALAADPSFAERFHREARALARLNHPNIVTVYDFGEQGGWYFLMMELVDGANLRQAMRAQRFSPEQALHIVPQICAALEYAHGEGVLHRDIKPENLLLDARGRVKIADFGIAKLGANDGAEPSLTLSGAQLGTVAYMAPEQIEQPSRVDHRADIYSLGVVFYEMLTGELPIGRFAAPSEKSPVGTQVDEVVFRTLEKEPARRFQSAGEMQTSVETLTDAGLSGPPPPPPPLPSSASEPQNLPPAASSPPVASEPTAPSPLPAAVSPRLPGARRWLGPGMAFGLMLAALLTTLINFIGIAAERSARMRSSEVSSYRMENDKIGLIIVGTLIVTLGVASCVVGWINLVRMRGEAPPRRGIFMAFIPALAPVLVGLWLVIAVNVRDEPLAWFDGIVLTGLGILWVVVWLNPHPRPWSLPAAAAFTLAVVPVLFLAHAWRGHADDVVNRWAQEMNLLQIRINELQNRRPVGVADAEITRLERDLSQLHIQARPSGHVPFSSGQRACFALAGCAAIGGTLLGWTTRRRLRLEIPARHRGRPLAEFAAWFWPVVAGPILLLFIS